MAANLWFVNPLGVCRKMSAMAYFLCSQCDKAISNLVYFGKELVSEKNISGHCSLTCKTNV
jgi:hypothetical protein